MHFCRSIGSFLMPCHTSSPPCCWGSVELHLSPRRRCLSAFWTNVLSTSETGGSHWVPSPDMGWAGNNVPSKPLQESDSLARNIVVENAYALAQHCSSPVLNRPPEFDSVSKYLSAFIVVPVAMKSINNTPIRSQNTVAMTLPADCASLNFRGLGEEECCHWRD